VTVAAVQDPTYAYRREARRLRSRHAGQPAQLYNSLRDLSDKRDRDQLEMTGKAAGARIWEGEAPAEPRLGRKSRLGGSLALPAKLHPGAYRSHRFAQVVAERVSEGVLRYSARLQLLAMADGLGIARFQANLVIAAVQHEAGHGITAAERSFHNSSINASGGGAARLPSGYETTSEPSRLPRWVPGVLLAVLLQSAIFVSGWLVFGSH
jgi:hypothetical protein